MIAIMVATTLSNSFKQGGDATAIIIPSKLKALTISYKELSADVFSFQQKIAKLGITPKSVVSIALPNTYEFIVAFLATSWQRAIAAPLNPAYKQGEFEFYIDDLKSTLVLVPRGTFREDGPAVRAARKHRAAVAECYWDPQRGEVVLDIKDIGKLKGNGNQRVQWAQPHDIALVLHTSGTTGRPKTVSSVTGSGKYKTKTWQVPLTHHNLTRTMSKSLVSLLYRCCLHCTENIVSTYKLTFEDRTMLVMPLFHVHGLLAGFLAPLLSGGSVVIPKKFSASEFWDDFITYKANWYTAVPTIHQILLKNPPPKTKPKIRFIRSCSSPLSPITFQQLEETYNAPVLEAYAMTEAAHQMTSNPLPPGKRLPGSVGIGQGVEVKVLDQDGNEVERGAEAEICVRGENITKGYLNNPDANKSSFTEDGFFRTGDQGKMDKDGYIFITGRIKELINKGGEKISPIELDNVLACHPAVSEAVSFAIPDEMFGQDIGVAVVLKSGQKLGEDELRTWVAEILAKFKVPRKVCSLDLHYYDPPLNVFQIYFTDNMPKTATGKIQRRTIADTMQKQDKPKAKL
jgi:oxalate---CoA ligase